jgi:hypothetical protein
MWAERIFDYVGDNSQETGLNISLVFIEKKSDSFETEFLPDSLDNDSSIKRVATYIDWYTEAAWLFIEDHGVGFSRMKEIFDVLNDEGINPYEFQEISIRKSNEIKIEELEDGFKVIDRKDEKFFSTESSDNPQKLNENRNNTTNEKV